MHENWLQSFSTDKYESKRIIVHKTLLQSFSTSEDESKRSIVNKNVSQYCSTDKDELNSKEEDKPEYYIRKQKYARNEVTYDV